VTEQYINCVRKEFLYGDNGLLLSEYLAGLLLRCEEMLSSGVGVTGIAVLIN
jgi:hypothetical protein